MYTCTVCRASCMNWQPDVRIKTYTARRPLLRHHWRNEPDIRSYLPCSPLVDRATSTVYLSDCAHSAWMCPVLRPDPCLRALNRHLISRRVRLTFWRTPLTSRSTITTRLVTIPRPLDGAARRVHVSWRRPITRVCRLGHFVETVVMIHPWTRRYV